MRPRRLSPDTARALRAGLLLAILATVAALLAAGSAS